jgi:MFS family permease
VATRWTAATLSASPLAVSAVDTLQFLPVMLLSLSAGTLADSIDRRRLLITTHASLAAITIMMGTLAAIGYLSLPVLLGLTMLIGALGALNGPAWQATVPRQVPDDEVASAVALISTGFNIARTLGPAIGAWVLLSFGAATAFFANAASYVIISLLMWCLPAQPPCVRKGSLASPLTDRSLRRMYGIVLLFGLFAMPSLSLLPIIARDALYGDALTYGTLLSAFGLGAACAGPFVAATARKLGYSVFVALSCLASAGGLALLSIAWVPSIAALGAAMGGVGWIGTISTTNAAVNTRARAEVRGRALAFYLTFAIGGQACGSFIGGWIAQYFGLTLVLRTCMLFLIILAIGVFNLSIRTEEEMESTP